MAARLILVSLAALCCASSASSATSQPTSTAIISTPAPTLTKAATATTATTPSSPSSSGPITTAPIFLPYYDDSSWSALRGSILSTDTAKNGTAYTIFCSKETDQSCNLALEFPFIIFEGPKTAEFHGTYTSTFIVDIECALDARTAATCSGYSSLKSGFKMGLVTGPTEFSWTSTLTGTDVEWGVLTLADVPKPTGEEEDSADVTMAPSKNTALLYLPTETPGSAASTQTVQAWAAVVVAASTIFASLLL